MTQHVQIVLMPRIAEVRREWESNYDGDSAEAHMSHLLEGLETLKKCFADDMMVVRNIENEIQRANEWIGDHEPEESERKPRELEKVETHDEQPKSERSIFDDNRRQ